MAITDLTGTTWTLGEALTRYPGDTSTLKTYSVNITTSEPITDGWGGESKSSFSAVAIGYDSGAENNRVRLDPSGGAYFLAMGNDTKTLPDTWVSRFEGTFTITGGADATNAVLIAWLEGNAEEPPQPDITVAYGGETILELSQTATKTLKTAGKYCSADILINYIKSGGGPVVTPFGIRGDAELVQSYGADELLVADLETAVPAYSTSAKTIITGAALAPTITLDYTNYNYFVDLRALTIPIYDTTTKQKGRCDYTISSYHYEIIEVPANEMKTIDRAKVVSTSRSVAVTALGSMGREVYWTSASAVTFATNSTYGAQCTGQAPAISSGVMTIKAPNYGIRGSTAYMTSGAWGHMTDIRYQWKIEVWRAPKGNAADGWQHTTNLRHVLANVRTDGKLT